MHFKHCCIFQFFFSSPQTWRICTENWGNLVKNCFQTRSSLRAEAWRVPASTLRWRAELFLRVVRKSAERINPRDKKSHRSLFSPLHRQQMAAWHEHGYLQLMKSLCNGADTLGLWVMAAVSDMDDVAAVNTPDVTLFIPLFILITPSL